MTTRVVLISGGTQGIGADIAAQFLTEGAIVYVLGRDAQTGAQLEQQLQPQGSLHFIQTDIQDDQALDQAIEHITSKHSHIHVLVNNACIYTDAGLASTREQWHQTLGVNLVSAAILSHKVVPYMPAGGVIVNMGSIGGKIAAAGRMLYPASKAALLQITKNMAAELAPKQLRVVAVSPAWTWSPALESMVEGNRQLADEVGAQTHLLGRVATGNEIAQVVQFVASPAASWITGVDIPVDGGFSVLGPDQGKGPRYWLAQTTST